MKEIKFNEEAMDKAIQKMVKEQEEKFQRSLTFIESERQDDVMEEVYQLLGKENRIDLEDIRYEPEKYPFTSEEFNFLFDHLRSFSSEYELVGQEDDNCFDHECSFVKYENTNIILRIMRGQGTSIQMYLGSEEEWVENLSFEYEEFKNEISFLLTEKKEQPPEYQVRQKTKKIHIKLNNLLGDLEELVSSNRFSPMDEETKKIYKDITASMNRSDQLFQAAFHRLKKS